MRFSVRCVECFVLNLARKISRGAPKSCSAWRQGPLCHFPPGNFHVFILCLGSIWGRCCCGSGLQLWLSCIASPLPKKTLFILSPFFLEELFKKDFWVLYPKFSDAAGISRCGQLLVGGAAVGARTSRGGWERGKSMEQIFAALLLLELWSTTVLSFPKRVSRLIFQALRPLLCLLPLPSICFVWSRSLGSFSTWVGKLS